MKPKQLSKQRKVTTGQEIVTNFSKTETVWSVDGWNGTKPRKWALCYQEGAGQPSGVLESLDFTAADEAEDSSGSKDENWNSLVDTHKR